MTQDARHDERRAWFRREILPLEPHLRAYARRFCRRGEAEVEDLVHEVFARAAMGMMVSVRLWSRGGRPLVNQVS